VQSNASNLFNPNLLMEAVIRCRDAWGICTSCRATEEAPSENINISAYGLDREILSALDLSG
jgi:hypothetical protein